MEIYVINWKWAPGVLAFITKNHSNRKPYTSNINDPDIKKWTTEKRAKLWLSRKDPLWASECEIVKVSISNPEK